MPDTRRIPVAFSIGDPHGVGPEVLLKALAHALPTLPIEPYLFGDPDFLQKLASDLHIDLDFDALHIASPGPLPYPPQWGELHPHAGRYAVESLRMAVEHCRESDAPLLVTAPLNKEAAHLAGDFPQGQTEFIGSFFTGAEAVMAFFSDRMHVVLATVHIPLREVPTRLKCDELVRRTCLFSQSLRWLGLESPRIAMCGLNPHASENGLFGDEEALIIAPAVDRINTALTHGRVDGPFPPDTIFRRLVSGEFDGAVALYHDQGLIPLKLLAFESAVNVSLGLPIVRTSPDHGTAFDIAGRGRADPSSMQAALNWGLRLAQGRLALG